MFASEETIPLLLSPEDLASFLGVNKGVIYHWCGGTKKPPIGFPPPIKIGRLLRWRKEDVLLWTEALAAASNGKNSRSNKEGDASQKTIHKVPLSNELTAPPTRKRGRPRKFAVV